MAGPQRVAMTGASGLVGRALGERLRADGRTVVAMVRDRTHDGGYWDPARGELDIAALVGVDAVVHLAGENIGGGRWTAARKRRIRDGRVDGTTLVAGTLAAMPDGPRIFVSASAVGFYGDRGEDVVDEDSPAGSGFLSEVCVAWEDAAAAARQAGVRVVHPRLALVLARGGALAQMLPAFRLGVGGRLGNGRQAMSWIALDDVVGALVHLLDGDLSGPVNLAAPNPVTNADFTAALGRVIRRPAFVPAPRFALELAFGGEMARSLLLEGARVHPKRLLESGYVFQQPELEPALRAILG